MINNYKHIIWDWNGTLLNDIDYCRKIINKILLENNLPELSLMKYRDIFTFPVQEYYKAAGLDFSKKSFEELGKQFMDDYEANKLTCSLHNNAFDVIYSIYERGLGQSVLSAYLHDNLVKILDHYKLTQYFDNIIGLDNIYAGSKTHLGLRLIEQLNLPVDKILFVGDTLHDAEVAKAMGVNCILIANGHQTKDKLKQEFENVLDDLSELMKYLSISPANIALS